MSGKPLLTSYSTEYRLPLIGRPYRPAASVAMRTAMVFIPANRGALADPEVHAALCVLIQMATSGTVRKPTLRIAFKQARRADYEVAVRAFCSAIGAWRLRQGLT
jgi:hypothetical protein